MLKLVHVQARITLKNGQASVKQMDAADAIDRRRAEEVISVFQNGLAQRLTREKLDDKLAGYAGNRLDYREIDGLAKVIFDSFSTFASDPLPLTSSPLSRTDYFASNSISEQILSETTEELDEDDVTWKNKNEAENENERNGEVENENEDESGESEEEAGTSPASGAGTRLGAFRLALWREAARPEFNPFHRPGLTVSLRPGVQSLRKAAASHDEDLLANLLPEESRRTLLQQAARLCESELAPDAPTQPGHLGNWLFADVPERHRLANLSPELNIENLINRYNIELLRGVLYLAPRIRLVVRDKYKDLFKYLKLFRLMHEIKPIPLSSSKSNGPSCLSDQSKAASQESKAESGEEETGWLAENEISGYEILLEGASSPFLARTDRRYGIQFARFLPALLLCEAEWELETELIFPAFTNNNQSNSKQSGREPNPQQGQEDGVYRAAYRLGPQPHLRTHFKGSGEYDSKLEEDLAAALKLRFQTTSRKQNPLPSVETENNGAAESGKSEVEEVSKLDQNSIQGQPEEEILAGKKKRKSKRKKVEGERQGWVIKREDRIIQVFDTVMIPDFAFEHRDGRRALLEVVGFWERGYLERKIAKLNRAGRTDLIVLVSERTRCGREHFLIKGEEPPYQLIFFKGKPQLGPILAALEKCASRLPNINLAK
jgi:predicted nuclease of restriction endonuclease-like RecB superfamily